MEQAGNLRKYVILQEKDPGFGVQRPPEGFARLDANKEGMTLSLQVKNLREGALPYTVILVYGRSDDMGVIRAGTLEMASGSGFFSRKLDAGAIQRMNIQPGNLLYVLVAAEHPEKTNIPMVGICNKVYPWNESVRQRLRKDNPHAAATEGKASPKPKWDPALANPNPSALMENPSLTLPDAAKKIYPQSQSDKDILPQPRRVHTDIPAQTRTEDNMDRLSQNLAEAGQDVFPQPHRASGTENRADKKPDKGDLSETIKQLFSEFRNSENITPVQARNPEKAEKTPAAIEDVAYEKARVDDARLERKLKECFEAMDPFSNARHDYAWYRVNDLARLSNLLFACNMRIPLFANPKILVGLFKYRHLLAGFYRSDRNDMKYFVLGVPARDDSEGRPFERISRWVEIQNPDYGDMTGYWLVYINLQSGEFVR